MTFRIILNSSLSSAGGSFFKRFPKEAEVSLAAFKSSSSTRFLSSSSSSLYNDVPSTILAQSSLSSLSPDTTLKHTNSSTTRRTFSSSSKQQQATTTILNDFQFDWEKLTPTADPQHGVPCKRSSHGLSLLQNGKLLILHGGEEIARTPLDKSQLTWAAVKQQPNDNDDDEQSSWSWRSISSTTSEEEKEEPPARLGHAQCVYNDTTVYIFGGRAGTDMGEEAMNDLWKLDCSNAGSGDNDDEVGVWSQVLPDPQKGDAPPTARSFHKMLCLGSSLYVFGGCDTNGRLADLHRFDIETNTWKTLPASSLLRGRGGANFLPFQNEKQLLLGVVAGFCGEETNDGHLFDPLTEEWTPTNDLLTESLKDLRPRSVCVASSFPSLGVNVIFGGEVDPSELGHEGAGGFENDLVLLEEHTGAYLSSTPATSTTGSSSSSSWPEPRGWSDGASMEEEEEEGNTTTGKLYVYGGLSGDDSNPRRLNDLWCLNIHKKET